MVSPGVVIFCTRDVVRVIRNCNKGVTQLCPGVIEVSTRDCSQIPGPGSESSMTSFGIFSQVAPSCLFLNAEEGCSRERKGPAICIERADGQNNPNLYWSRV